MPYAYVRTTNGPWVSTQAVIGITFNGVTMFTAAVGGDDCTTFVDVDDISSEWTSNEAFEGGEAVGDDKSHAARARCSIP